MARHRAEDNPNGTTAEMLVIENRGCPDGHFTHEKQSDIPPMPASLRRRIQSNRSAQIMVPGEVKSS